MRRSYALVPMVAAVGLYGCQTNVPLAEADSFTMLPEYVKQETWECAGAFQNLAFGEADYCIIIKEGPQDGRYAVMAYQALGDDNWGMRVGLNARRQDMPINLRYLTTGKALTITCDASSACLVERGSPINAFGTIFLQDGNVMAAFGNDDGSCEVIPGSGSFGHDYYGETAFYHGSNARTVRSDQSTNVPGFGEVRCNAGRVTIS